MTHAGAISIVAFVVWMRLPTNVGVVNIERIVVVVCIVRGVKIL